ncbi:MAG: SgcJ/EcaC family oxidoreductase [Akkermansiaceae bacterium]|nr:SgcJ/EcaC family oxidoreductase [Akkermansiaceae bacterium]
MKIFTFITALLAVSGSLGADETSRDISGLEAAAMEFVKAYGARDAAAISMLFTEDAEMTDLDAADLASGRKAIKSRYEAIFASEDVPEIAVEVSSVRLVAPNLAIEDGTIHLTPAGDGNVPPRSTAYTAVLLKGESGAWKVASTRTLKDVTTAAGHLADLAKVINGEWTNFNPEGVRFDLAIGWDPSGKFLVGDMLTTAADAEPQKGSIRIGWNAARKSIISWMFDVEGGVTRGIWNTVDDGWLIRSEGNTAEGEAVSAIQKVTTNGDDVLIWEVTNRVVDGVKQPEASMRLVPPAPEPTSE